MISTASPTLHKLTHGCRSKFGSISRVNVFVKFDNSIDTGVVRSVIVVLFWKHFGEK